MEPILKRGLFSGLSAELGAAQLRIPGAELALLRNFLTELDSTQCFGELFRDRQDAIWRMRDTVDGQVLAELELPSRRAGEPRVRFLGRAEFRSIADRHGVNHWADAVHFEDRNDICIPFENPRVLGAWQAWVSPLLKGMVYHEFLHSQGKAEFEAYRGQLSFYQTFGIKLDDTELKKLGTDDDVLRYIGNHYDSARYCEAVLERFGLQVGDAMNEWLPGGARYTGQREKARAESFQDFGMAAAGPHEGNTNVSLALLRIYFRSHRAEYPMREMTVLEFTDMLLANSAAMEFARSKLSEIYGCPAAIDVDGIRRMAREVDGNIRSGREASKASKKILFE